MDQDQPPLEITRPPGDEVVSAPAAEDSEQGCPTGELEGTLRVQVPASAQCAADLAGVMVSRGQISGRCSTVPAKWLTPHAIH